MSDKTLISLSLHNTLLHKLDVAAKDEFCNRSEFIRQAIVEKLRPSQEYEGQHIRGGDQIDILMSDSRLQRILDVLNREKFRRAGLRDMRQRGRDRT